MNRGANKRRKLHFSTSNHRVSMVRLTSVMQPRVNDELKTIENYMVFLQNKLKNYKMAIFKIITCDFFNSVFGMAAVFSVGSFGRRLGRDRCFVINSSSHEFSINLSVSTILKWCFNWLIKLNCTKPNIAQTECVEAAISNFNLSKSSRQR